MCVRVEIEGEAQSQFSHKTLLEEKQFRSSISV